MRIEVFGKTYEFNGLSSNNKHKVKDIEKKTSSYNKEIGMERDKIHAELDNQRCIIEKQDKKIVVLQNEIVELKKENKELKEEIVVLKKENKELKDDNRAIKWRENNRIMKFTLAELYNQTLEEIENKMQDELGEKILKIFPSGDINIYLVMKNNGQLGKKKPSKTNQPEWKMMGEVLESLMKTNNLTYDKIRFMIRGKNDRNNIAHPDNYKMITEENINTLLEDEIERKKVKEILKCKIVKEVMENNNE